MVSVRIQHQNLPSQNLYNIPGGPGGLGELALLHIIGRFNYLEKQLRAEFGDMQKRTDWLNTSNSALAALRANRPDDENATKDYGTFVDAHGKTWRVVDFLRDNGIPNDKDAGNQSDFDATISNLKARIDTENSESQILLIHLQSLMDKVNQCAELASNLLSKDGKAKDNILGNIR
ncbi:hypothetical protein IE4803_PB00148 (plasmid) [Rhizobium etli bv. phaseoli str. IE4803]|nr:hypothetical protein IE4803_PB00148 [Rhizobium etli bv. phaseoli str. IE4803]